MPEAAGAAGKAPESPLPVAAPPTQTLPHLNQQINVFPTIPPDTWGQFSAEQAVQIITQALKTASEMSERQFSLSMDQARRAHDGERLRVILGSVVYALLLGTAGILGWRGDTVIAGLIVAGAASSMFTVFGRWLK